MTDTPAPKRRSAWKRTGLVLAGVLAVLVIAVALFAALFDWNLLRGPIGRQASLMSGRTVRLNGNLKVHLFSFTPEAVADDLEIGGSNGIPGDLARVGRFDVKIKLLPLLVGRVELPLLDLEGADINAVRNAAGKVNWRTAANGTPPMKLPPIQRLIVNNGHLHLADQVRRLTLDASLQSRETDAGSGKGTFQLSGRGALNRNPFSLELSGPPLLNVRADRPYTFNADLRAGQTHVLAQGALTRPFDFGQVRTALIVSGADLADLYYLTGVALPNTPAYRLSGDLLRDGRKYSFSRVKGHVGHSDLQGGFQVDHTGPRPFVRADLRSDSLDMADLGAVVGAPVAGAARSPLQQAQAAKLAAQDRLLPDATLDVARVRSTDAVVRYVAGSVIARPNLPLRQVTLDLKLDHGVMTADPVAFSFPQGQLVGRVRLDARGAVPQDDADLKISNVRLQDFLAKSGSPPLEGVLEARAKLTGQGASVHEVAATADGVLTLVVPHGEVRQSLGELLGIDATRGLGLLLAKDKSEMGVRCAVADFEAKDGILTARNIVFDSDTVLTTGKGTVNLKDETVDLTLQGAPKEFRLVRVMAPITIGGHLKSMKIGVKPGAAPLQAGAAVALGVLFPPLALLPFVNPGLAHDADCAAAVRDAQSLGAPVKVSATTQVGAKAAPKRRR